MFMDEQYLENAGAIFNGMRMDVRYLKNAGAHQRLSFNKLDIKK
jgi:hypothetical protein